MTSAQTTRDVGPPICICPYIPKGQALLLRMILEDAVTGYAPSNPRWALLKRVEEDIAQAWPEEAR